MITVIFNNTGLYTGVKLCAYAIAGADILPRTYLTGDYPMQATITKLPISTPTKRAAPKRATIASRVSRNQALAGAVISIVALALVGLSLTHLAHGIALITGAPTWEAIALAIGIDLGFVALELATVAASNDKLRRNISKYTTPAILGTLAGSAALNALAFASGATTTWGTYAAAGLGLSIPALVYALTRVGTALYLETTKA